MKILIADAGATKTDWVRLSLNGDSDCKVESYSGIGISPLHHDTDMIEEELRLVRASLGDSFEIIRFFGAGIGSPVIAGKMEAILSEMFSCRDIKADSDMAGAARAVLGDTSGIACIMGTGSNSCHYDGEKIDRKSASLGYLLDDQGGAVAYCRRLLREVFKRTAPVDIVEKFNQRYDLTVSDVVEHLYRRPSPNRWIAGFMPFIVEYIDHPYIHALVETQTGVFFDSEFNAYSAKQLQEEGMGFVGSVASELRLALEKAVEKRGWKLRDVVRNPIDSLVDLYKKVEDK